MLERSRLHRSSLLVALAVLSVAATGAGGAPSRETACSPARAGAADTARIARALRSGRDLWGEELLRAPGGPTYEGARRYLGPLVFARAAGKTSLTSSGVHYVPFAQPLDARGAGAVALHLADGSGVVAERVGGRTLTVRVGAEGREVYGSCLRRLATPSLAEGYLPILRNAYTDARGTRYRQESFTARLPGRRALTSFVELTASSSGSAADIRIGGLRFPVAAGATRTVYVAWGAGPATVDEEAYRSARESVRAYWQRRLAEGAEIVVPEQRVMDAQRALLIQNLALTWRYSIGNAYEQFSFPESVDVAQVLAEHGFRDVSAAILRTALTRKPTPYPNWKMGEKLLGSAVHYRLFRDRAYVRHATPALRRYVAILGRQIRASGRGILGRERYSSDIPDSVLGLHSQAVAWQGLRAMAGVWAETGDAALAREARALAARLGAGLRRAVAASQTRLPDGSLFVPVRLLDGERPYDRLTRSRPGSYWNLVMPYALASGLFAPRGPQANGIFAYMQRHGSRLLGLVRAGAYALYRDPAFPTSGTDEVYGINVARFLADNDRPDQLVLSLYGQLAAAMTPGTFVAGEAASVAPLAGAAHRAMYLPPNGASNAAFLAKLRLLLVHERRNRAGEPRGLELAFATPRAWLRPGRRIAVRRVPTSFGPVSFSLAAAAESVTASLEVPERARRAGLRLRLRLPRPARIAGAVLNGVPFRGFDARSETIDLSGRSGRLELVVRTAGRAFAEEPPPGPGATPEPPPRVRTVTVHYRAHNGARRAAHVLVPMWYRPGNTPLIPLVISPHGRGLTGRHNVPIWGSLPADGPFAVVSPDGQGRRLARYSWGYRGQIDDLARMPEILRRTLPWLRIDRDRVYAFGGSMGGQEVLLLGARYPEVVAGVAAFDAVTNFARQYRAFPRLPCDRRCRRLWKGPLGATLQRMARVEVGGTPTNAAPAYAARSPVAYLRSIAFSCVPIQLWWSVADRVVVDQEHQSARLFWNIRGLNPIAPVEAFVGFWIHTSEMRAKSQLPRALASFGLLERAPDGRGTVRWIPAERSAGNCTPAGPETDSP